MNCYFVATNFRVSLPSPIRYNGHQIFMGMVFPKNSVSRISRKKSFVKLNRFTVFEPTRDKTNKMSACPAHCNKGLSEI